MIFKMNSKKTDWFLILNHLNNHFVDHHLLK